ncbi:ESX secretion-associated protein EspG [Nocardia arthritidis]|uniref:ESX secretion-associated protein EspG n=1 Tax=Nocardia arthritidis TaxID=228602 RepID=A0A6G9Y800_9NOCA|nr:ESX secretion-associated protein EspG [Nocardia arthritidis]QIS09183.1 ESX secretion-associated protein EspG [Nocardia arthritidis]
MNQHWSFTDLEFVALWAPLREDVLPQPFTHVTDISSGAQYEYELRSARARLDSIADGARELMLQDIARPDLTVLVRALDGRDRRDPAGSIRMLAARREERGYLVTQLPGRTVDHSGGFTVTECHALDLAATVVAALPDVPPGRQGRVTLPGHDDGMDHSFEMARWRDTFDDTEERGRNFLRAPAPTIGRIEIRQGVSRFGPRGRTIRVLFWRDLLDDGRYAIVPANPPVAAPANARALIDMLDTEISTIVRAIEDEQAFQEA